MLCQYPTNMSIYISIDYSAEFYVSHFTLRHGIFASTIQTVENVHETYMPVESAHEQHVHCPPFPL